MAIEFIGNCEWQRVTDPQWTVDSWGVDTAKLLFRGRRDKKLAFEKAIQRFQTMPGFSQFRMEQWSNSGGTENLPGVEFSYKGFLSGTTPPVKIVNSNTRQSAQGSGTDTSTDNPTSGQTISGTVYYRSYRSTYTWFETSSPAATPRYTAVQGPSTIQAGDILGYNVKAGNGADAYSVNSLTFAQLYAVLNSLAPRTIYSDYQREPIINGALWGCSVSCDLILEAT